MPDSERPWWLDFFDGEYVRVWGRVRPPEATRAEADGLWERLQLHAGARVLDAPCGYGRIARELADRGVRVVGVDLSRDMLEHAEATRGEHDLEHLRYIHHDLRQPLGEGGFDAAICMFSSLGYGDEDDDVAMLSTLRAAVEPAGHVFVETMHRDIVVARMVQNRQTGTQRPDGTVMTEYAELDAIAGRIQTTWRWSGPDGEGSRSASIRIYCATELVRLLERAGLHLVSAHRGTSAERFDAMGPDVGGRLGLLARPG